jgi:hypothetical protein
VSFFKHLSELKSFLAVPVGLKLLQQSPGNHRIPRQNIFRTSAMPTSKPSGSGNLEISHAVRGNIAVQLELAGAA